MGEYRILFACASAPILDWINKNLPPSKSAPKIPGSTNCRYLSFKDESVVLETLDLTRHSDKFDLWDVKEEINPNFTVIAGAGLAARPMGDAPAAFICPAVRRIVPDKPRNPVKAGSVRVISYPVGACRVQTIKAWISQEEWVSAFKGFQHNETPTCVEGDVLLVPPPYLPSLGSILPDYPAVQLIDKSIAAMSDLGYLRRSSAIVLYAPPDCVREFAATAFDAGGVDERATATSCHLLISIIGCIAYCDQKNLRQELPPVPQALKELPAQPNATAKSTGSVTFKKGREAEIMIFLAHMNGYTPDCSTCVLKIKDGSIVVDFSTTERDGLILSALFESGIYQYLVDDERNEEKRKILEKVDLSGFHFNVSATGLPLYYSEFADEILRLGKSNNSSDRLEAWRSMTGRWKHEKSIERIATALADSESLSGEFSSCG